MTARPLVTELEALEARVGARLATGLSARAAELPHDLSERLRVAREQAVVRARQPARQVARQAAAAPAFVGRTASGAGLLGSPWWLKLASGLPLLVLVIGLVLIDQWTRQEQVIAAAEIDAKLLADELPPQAYVDPGFAEFLKSPPP